MSWGDPRSRAELIAELAEAEARAGRAADLYDYAPIGLCSLDRHGRLHDLNLAAATLLGLDRRVGTPTLAASLASGDLAAIMTHVAGVLASGERATLEITLLRDGAGVRTIQLESIPSRESADRTATVISDVSARRRVEDVLHFLTDATARIGRGLDRDHVAQQAASATIPLLADLAGVEWWVDEDFVPVTLERRNVEVAVPPGVGPLALLPRARDAARRVVAHGRPQLITDVSNHLDDVRLDDAARSRLIALDLRSTVVVPLFARLRAVGVLVCMMAESGRRHTAEDVVMLTDLGARVSAALGNARLHEDVIAASRAKEEFFARVSHDLRAPVVNLMLWADVLSRNPAPPQRDAAIAAIMASARLQKRLVDDLLELSRGGSATLSFTPERVPLCDVVDEAIAGLAGDAQMRRVSINVVGRPRTEVWGDRGRLRQIITNLLSNAIKFSDLDGHVVVEVVESSVSVTVTVLDAGAGIAPDLIPELFEPFRQGSERRGEGLGLGLAIVKHLVELHGGTVTAASAGIGKGAAFTVNLPRMVDDERAIRG